MTSGGWSRLPSGSIGILNTLSLKPAENPQLQTHHLGATARLFTPMRDLLILIKGMTAATR